MNKEFHKGNRERLYQMMKPHSLMVLFSGKEKTKTNDEYYPFYANRSFVYLTGEQGICSRGKEGRRERYRDGICTAI